VTDLGDEDHLSRSIAELSDLSIRYVLGRHEEADLSWADLVVRNPAIPHDSDFLSRARELGVPIAMELALFIESTAGTVVGVTGSKGKTTTSFAIHHLMSGSFPRVGLAGNMGISAINQDRFGKDDVAVIEVSSFQAEGMTDVGVAPDVFVITNLLEDHLDRYSGIEEYHEAKVSVLDHQGEDSWAILPSHLPDTVDLDDRRHGRRAYFGTEPPPDPQADAVFATDGVLRARWQGAEITLGSLSDLPIQGRHYAENIAAAAAAAMALGVSPEEIGDRLPSLPTIEHRQEHVAEVDGVDYVNDSAATVPAATAASVTTYASRDIVLIAGGSSKRLDPEPLALPVAELARAVVLLDGDATEGIRAALRSRGFDDFHGPLGSMGEAVETAAALAKPGSVVLLAPGATSFGMFADEFDRGSQFREAVRGRRRSGSSRQRRR
jgi:UDP-N-acetylmuramoylalanine--D-glutamate ligase